jgi:hypothetical protein
MPNGIAIGEVPRISNTVVDKRNRNAMRVPISTAATDLDFLAMV